MGTLFIQQPYFFPWLGFFAKLSVCDTYVALDNGALRRTHMKRAAVMDGSGTHRWLTCPVGGHRGQPLNEVRLPTERRFVDEHLKALRLAYGSSPQFHSTYPTVQDVFTSLRDPDLVTLADANLHVIKMLSAVLDVERSTLKASDLLSERLEREQQLQALLSSLRPEALVTGDGGSLLVHDMSTIALAGLRVLVLPFATHHPRYQQSRRNGSRAFQFQPGLSVLDAMFNVGVDATKSLIRDVPVVEYAAWISAVKR